MCVTDSLYVLRGWARLEHNKAPPTTNRDLWEDLKKHLRDRNLSFKKIESHMTMAEALGGGTDLRWWVGNNVADAIASEMAAATQVP